MNGTWPDRAATTLDAVGSATLGSAAVLITAGDRRRVRPGHDPHGPVAGGSPSRVEILPDTVPGQTAVTRRDLASLVRIQVEQVDGVHSAVVTARRSQVDIVVLSVMDDLAPVREAARKKADEALDALKPVGITRSRVRIRHTS